MVGEVTWPLGRAPMWDPGNWEDWRATKLSNCIEGRKSHSGPPPYRPIKMVASGNRKLFGIRFNE